ncbi:MAG: aspartate kinase [Saprospiraceae bacterium]|nr:aspartate kinase [Saprospiraceae bacterium]
MGIRVFKFGGASVKDADSVRNVTNIIQQHASKPLVVVISAMGKTTNAMEKVVNTYFDDGDAFTALETVKTAHQQIIDDLFEESEREAVYQSALNHFVEVEWAIEDGPVDTYDYVYDQIVSVGELVSTSIVAAYLKKQGVAVQWVDARGLIKTDRTFREGKIDWPATTAQVLEELQPIVGNKVAITQGFIGSTDDNETTTLGREGSDFTGAILANLLNAETQTIWKDVPGVLNADPRKFEGTQLIEELSYKEAVEMTYYGASVIHPKTIKPLQNKGIPLIVRSFIDQENTGTRISSGGKPDIDVPVIIKKVEQHLIQFTTKDFSFIGEQQMYEIMKVFARYNIDINMMQNGAIRFAVLVNNWPEDIAAIRKDLEPYFDSYVTSDLELLTLRHYNEEDIEQFLTNKTILLEQKTAVNYQVVFKG